MPIRYDVDGAVVVITIDRPEAMNALDPEHNDELAAAWRSYCTDESLRAAVLTGAGTKAFSAGADLKRLIPAIRDRIRSGEDAAWVLGGMTWDAETTKPAVAAVNGHALAGGMELALACDLRLCSPNATFGLAETRWAIIPGAGGTQRLPRAVSPGVAMEMILTGDPINAQTAVAHGLVNRIVEQDGLLNEALRVARSIAAKGPLAVRAAKQAVYAGLDHGIAHGLEQEQRLFREVMRSDDAVEGSTAFAEKRDPVYRGR